MDYADNRSLKEADVRLLATMSTQIYCTLISGPAGKMLADVLTHNKEEGKSLEERFRLASMDTAKEMLKLAYKNAVL